MLFRSYRINDQGVEVPTNAQLQRIFESPSTTSSGELEVKHAWFTLPEEMQGSGCATELMAACVKTYQSLGVKRIKIHAGLDNGAYTWARLGFLPDGMTLSESIPGVIELQHEFEGELTEMIQIARRRGAISDEDVTRLTTAAHGRTALWRVADDPKGEEVLAGNSWSGTFEIDNPLQMKRLMHYVGEKRAQKTDPAKQNARRKRQAKRPYKRDRWDPRNPTGYQDDIPPQAKPIWAHPGPGYEMPDQDTSLSVRDEMRPHEGFVRRDGTVDSAAFYDELLGDDDFEPTEDDYDDGPDDVPTDPLELDEFFDQMAFDLDAKSWEKFNAARKAKRQARTPETGHAKTVLGLIARQVRRGQASLGTP